MTSKRKLYKTYTRKCKLEALRMMDELDRPSSEIATQLQIRRNQLYNWKELLQKKGDSAFSIKSGRPLKENQSETSKL
jgi:transposase